MKLKSLLLIFALFIGILTACNSGSENKGANLAGKTGISDLNTEKTNTLFDSLPVEKTPYTDSISVDDSKPLRKIALNKKQLDFLKIRQLRAFRDYGDYAADSQFTAVCRLKLSPDFYSVIINFSSENESMDYLITYDQNFKVVDYLEVSYDEIAESASRIISVIDTGSIRLTTYSFWEQPGTKEGFVYNISSDGFFREDLNNEVAAR